MRSWWDNQSWRLGNLGKQRFCVVRQKKFIKISWWLILLIIQFFWNLKNILSKIHLLLTPNRKHRKVFENAPIIAFKKGKSLKDILVKTKIPPLKTEEGFCGLCNKPKCEYCKHITKPHQFESSSTRRICSIRQQNLNCAFKNVVYIFTCKTFYKQYRKLWRISK